MDATTSCLSEHEEKILDLLNDIMFHGFGEITIRVTETQNLKTKVQVLAGKSWVYFIERKTNEYDNGIL